MTTDDPAPVPAADSGPGFSTLAALSDRVNELAGDVRYLKARIERGGGGTADYARRITRVQQNLDDVAEQVAKLALTFTELTATGPLVQAPYWMSLDPAEYAKQLTPVKRWVDTVLIPEYEADIKPCWGKHRVIVWEVSTFHAYWLTIYAGKNRKLKEAMDFFDRWLPGLLRRIRDVQKDCKTTCARDL